MVHSAGQGRWGVTAVHADNGVENVCPLFLCCPGNFLIAPLSRPDQPGATRCTCDECDTNGDEEWQSAMVCRHSGWTPPTAAAAVAAAMECRADICGDLENDCCAPGSEARVCTEPGYTVMQGGTSTACRHLPDGIYQCCSWPSAAVPMVAGHCNGTQQNLDVYVRTTPAVHGAAPGVASQYTRYPGRCVFEHDIITAQHGEHYHLCFAVHRPSTANMRAQHSTAQHSTAQHSTAQLDSCASSPLSHVR